MALDPAAFTAASLRRSPWGNKVMEVLAASLDAVDPYQAVLKHVRRQGSLLLAGEQSYNLDEIQQIWVVGAGKAGAPMSLAAASLLGDRLAEGLVIVKEGHSLPAEELEAAPPNFGLIRFVEAGHPVPDQRGVDGAREMQELLQKAGPDDLVVCLISGGGSALLAAPAEGLELAHLQDLTSQLLASGANIQEINSLRKHLETLKGGGLARAAAPARVLSLVLSDVVGDPLDVIASGPAVPDTTTFEVAHLILEKYDLLETVPQPVAASLERGRRGELPETPKPGDPVFQAVQNVIVGSNRQAGNAAVERARALGMNAALLTTRMQGEARRAGPKLAALARQVPEKGSQLSRPVCLVAGGETTVTLRGQGLGGRNQELALSAASGLAGVPGTVLVALATDGGDGPTPAAGAVVTGETVERALKLGLDPAVYLARNDSFHFFEKLGDLLLPGPTRTNVNDLAFLFLF